MGILFNIIIAAAFAYIAARHIKAGIANTVFGAFNKDQHPAKFWAYVGVFIAFSLANMVFIYLKLS